MKNSKAKGSRGERELIKYFNEAGWCAIRAAGSGSSRYPSPDILAANAMRRIAMECKVTKDNKKYFSAAEIKQLQTFSTKFGAESWVGIKFGSEDWYFFMLEDLDNTGSSWAASLKSAQIKGLRLHELLGRDSLLESEGNH